MPSRRVLHRIVFGLVFLSSAGARADIETLARCQARIAREGAKFAQKVIKVNLDCTTRIAKCQIECEQGVYGPPCDPTPTPGCCDPDDPSSTPDFQECMDRAEAFCAQVPAKIANYESRKQTGITNVCALLSQTELCSSTTPGLNFDVLNAGCQALTPSYTCSLPNMLGCVGGPLERKLADQITGLLHPRASRAITALGLQGAFPDLPTVHKVAGTVGEGKADVWQLTGQAGDEVEVSVLTRDDGGGVSSVHPALILLQSDLTPIPDVSIGSAPCNVPTVCGSPCPQLKRRLPFSGAYHAAIAAMGGDSCVGGGYRLVVTHPNSAAPVLVQDDVPASSIFP